MFQGTGNSAMTLFLSFTTRQLPKASFPGCHKVTREDSILTGGSLVTCDVSFLRHQTFITIINSCSHLSYGDATKPGGAALRAEGGTAGSKLGTPG